MDELLLQAETKSSDSAPPSGCPLPDARQILLQEPVSMSIPTLPQIEVANIEIAALADLRAYTFAAQTTSVLSEGRSCISAASTYLLQETVIMSLCKRVPQSSSCQFCGYLQYQQQLAEICAEHSLLLEDQAKLAKLIAPFLDEHGYVSGEFSETILLLKQGLDLRLLEYEEDCRRIQQTERRLQRKIDDILVNDELLALEAQGVAESRLQEQVKNMRRIIRVLQSELDETRFQRDVYADETRRLRGICRFGHWTEDGYGISEGLDDENDTPLGGLLRETRPTSQLPASAVRQPRQSSRALTCLKASQRALGSVHRVSGQRENLSRGGKEIGIERGGPRKSRTLESDISAEAEEEGKREGVLTRNGKPSEPSLFKEMLAKLLGGPEDFRRPPAEKWDSPRTASVVQQRQSETSVARRRVDAKRYEGRKTDERKPAVVRRHRTSSTEDGRPKGRTVEETEEYQRWARIPQDAQRVYSAALEDSQATAPRGRPRYRSTTESEEQMLTDLYAEDDRGREEQTPSAQNDRELEKFSMMRTRSTGALEGEILEKEHVTEGKTGASTRRQSSTTEAGLLPSRQEHEGNDAIDAYKDRSIARTATYSGPVREALPQQSSSSSENLTNGRSARQTTRLKSESLPHTRSEVLDRSPSPKQEETRGFAYSLRTMEASDKEKTSDQVGKPAVSEKLAVYSHVEVPWRDRRKSVDERQGQVKQPQNIHDAFPRRFHSRTLASPRLSRETDAPYSHRYSGERDPVGEASASSDLLLPAWRRARTLHSPTSRASVESALQSPRWSNVGANRQPASSTDRYAEENAYATWERRAASGNKHGSAAQATSPKMDRYGTEVHMPRVEGSRRSESRPRMLSVASRSSSAFTTRRRLASPRSFAGERPSEGAASSVEFSSREQGGSPGENIFVRRATNLTEF